MKFSIITPTLNSEKSIAYTLNSVFNQAYKNYEHIIVDGGSKDRTLEIVKKHKIKNKIIIKMKSSIYEAINIGIKKSSGEYIIILHSDDILNSDKTLKKIANILNSSKPLVLLGNVCFYNNFVHEKIVRFYSSKNFKTWMMFIGLMPPHTGSIIHRNIFNKYGLYNKKLRIAGDFEFFLRLFVKYKIPFTKLDLIVSRMRTGGVSGENIFAHLKSSKEIIKSFKYNKVKTSFILIYLRSVLKIHQLFNFDQKKINHDFKFKVNKHYQKIGKYDFKILSNLKKIDYNKNFTLSALNLAFLGSYAKGEIIAYNELINWPDGVFAKVLNKKLAKIPGRDVIKKIKIPKNISKITILGNLSENSRIYLQNKFHIKVNHVNLPFGDLKIILKDLKYKITKNEILFITLPTPKQEQVARHLAYYNKYFKIICIGGSINIASGEEKEVPKIFSKFEFIWRLRYDTLRRLKRLFKTFYSYLIATYITKGFRNKNAKII